MQSSCYHLHLSNINKWKYYTIYNACTDKIAKNGKAWAHILKELSKIVPVEVPCNKYGRESEISENENECERDQGIS